MSEFYVYEITYNYDGSQYKYIGQRKCPKTRTPETDIYMGSSDTWPFKKHMIKEFSERYTKRIIVSGLNQEQADRIEIELISMTPFIPLLAGTHPEKVKLPSLRLYTNFHPGGQMGNIRGIA